MIGIRFLTILLLYAALAPPLTRAQDLSSYRGFQLGMDLPAVVQQAEMKPSEVKLIHQRPAVIQELEWRPPHTLGGSLPNTDPVREVVLSFYNGELFQVVVNYDRYRTAGLTDDDVIEATSAKYGSPTRPAGKTISFAVPQPYGDAERVLLACWEDAQYSLNFFRSSYGPTFGMVAFSKRVDSVARAAVLEAVRLDEQSAPEREVARQKKQDDGTRAAQEKARLVNKPALRP
jgi:hypothetical protein